MRIALLMLGLTGLFCSAGCANGRVGNSVHSVTLSGAIGHDLLVTVDAGSMACAGESGFGLRDNLRFHFGEAHVELRLESVEEDDGVPEASWRFYEKRVFLTHGTNIVLVKNSPTRVAGRLRITGAVFYDSDWFSLNKGETKEFRGADDWKVALSVDDLPVFDDGKSEIGHSEAPGRIRQGVTDEPKAAP